MTHPYASIQENRSKFIQPSVLSVLEMIFFIVAAFSLPAGCCAALIACWLCVQASVSKSVLLHIMRLVWSVYAACWLCVQASVSESVLLHMLRLVWSVYARISSPTLERLMRHLLPISRLVSLLFQFIDYVARIYQIWNLQVSSIYYARIVRLNLPPPDLPPVRTFLA